MVTTEIHVPISLSPAFANMSRFLVKSIAANAKLPGDWRVIFTVSRDVESPLDSSPLSWSTEYPVEFRWVDQVRWDRDNFLATIVQRHTYDFTADAVLFMDADIVVVGPLTELVTETAGTDTIAGWPAWAPPPHSHLDELLAERGCSQADWGLTYSGYGLQFLAPKSCPPYFNFGLVAASNATAKRLGRDLPDELRAYRSRYDDWFGGQIALCLTIIDKHYPYRALDMRYNLGNGDWSDRSKLSGPEVDAAYLRAMTAALDPRVLHYCVATQPFSKLRDMASMDRIVRFCDMRDVGAGNALLQTALRNLL